MQEDKVIQQADQALQGQADILGRRSSLQLRIDIKNSQKEVQSLIHRFHNLQRPSQQIKKQNNDRNVHISWFNSMEQKQRQNSLNRSKVCPQPLSRFNYYGKYRFEEKQKQMHIQQPSFRNLNKTEVFLPPQIEEADSILTQPKQKQDSIVAQHSILENKLQIQYPNRQYYLLFDKQQARRKNLVRKQKVFPFQQGIQKNKPNWVLQRKIKALQKQVKQLRKQSQTQKDFMRKTDQPIRLKRGVQRMIETLWP